MWCLPRGGSRRSFPGGIIIPTILVVLGILFLLSNFGVISGDFWTSLWRFWPLILVLLGIEIILGVTRGWVSIVLALLAVGIVVVLGFALAFGFRSAGGWSWREQASQEWEVELGDIAEAEVLIKFGAGEVDIGSLPSRSTKLMEGDLKYDRSRGDPIKELEQRDGKGILTLSAAPGKGVQIGVGGEEWDIKFSRNIPLDLSLEIGAASVDLDLESLNIRNLRLQVGASDVKVVFPESAGTTTATIKAGVARIILDIPEGVAARINTDLGLSSLDIDKGRFKKSDGYYVSPGYETAKNRLDLSIDTGVASVTIK